MITCTYIGQDKQEKIKEWLRENEVQCDIKFYEETGFISNITFQDPEDVVALLLKFNI